MRTTFIKTWQINNGNNIDGQHKSLQKLSRNNGKKSMQGSQATPTSKAKSKIHKWAGWCRNLQEFSSKTNDVKSYK